jgi:predicted O-methyltransferase YrrM
MTTQQSMNLEQALIAIAKQLDLDAAALIAYAREDYFTGWDNGRGMFPIGSLFGVEGQVLYALVRALEVTGNIVELGTQYGASAAHMALACHKRGGAGRVITVDTQESSGSYIPDDLRAYITPVHTDALEYLKSLPDDSVHLLFEDLWHDEVTCEAIGLEAPRVLITGGVLVAHDALHPIVGERVVAGYDAAGIEYETYLIEPSDCGLLITQPNKIHQAPVAVDTAPRKIAAKGIAVDTKPKATRKRKTTAK